MPKNMTIVVGLFIALITSCSGVSVIKQGPVAPEQTGLYSTAFLEKISGIKEKYKQGKADLALADLKAIGDDKLTPIENAFKRNLMGVILFSQRKFEQASYHFELAQTAAKDDPSLSAQVKLNLASSFFRLGQGEKSFSVLQDCDPSKLTSEEAKKHAQLYAKLAKDLGHANVEVEALAATLADKKDLESLKADPNYVQLKSTMQKLSTRERLVFLEGQVEKNKLLAGHLGMDELENSYYDQTRDDAKGLLNWLESSFGGVSEVQERVSSFKSRMESAGKMDPMSIGLVLPLTGKKRQFADRALFGLDSAKSEHFKRNPGARPYKVFIKDTEGSPAVGHFRVRELIDQHRVSVIIGGLFPDEATKEYLEARKHGVLFISLSQVYLPKEQKNHLLVEIPGSIESQMEKLFSKEMLNKFGRRAAIMAPDDQMGHSYVDEFWRKANASGVNVTGVHSFDKSLTDFREPVKQILGLRFRRERQEEFDILNELYSLEKNPNVRRVNVLRPQVDFDWIFIPALPKEAMQIVPIFGYYDAVRLSFIGGPSWRSQGLGKEAQKWGDVHFVGDDVDPEDPQDMGFVNSFSGLFGRRPRLIEMTAYDAFAIINKVLSVQGFSSRSELDSYMRSKDKLVGLTGEWSLQDGVWIKNMTAFKLRKGKIEKVF